MRVHIHAFNEYHKTNKGKNSEVIGAPSFSLSRGKDGQLSLTITTDDCSMIGTGGQGGALGESVKFINRTAEVVLRQDELLALSLALQKALFGVNTRPVKTSKGRVRVPRPASQRTRASV